LPNADILWTRGNFSDVEVRTIGAKNIKFFEIDVVSEWTRGVEPVQIKEEGVNFLQFCADILYRGSL